MSAERYPFIVSPTHEPPELGQVEVWVRIHSAPTVARAREWVARAFEAPEWEDEWRGTAGPPAEARRRG